MLDIRRNRKLTHARNSFSNRKSGDPDIRVSIKGFKATLSNIFKALKENVAIMKKHMGNFSREIGTIKKEPNGN